MDFQILELILWPRTADAPARSVRFAPGVVNVISGASKTGKSAIIPIIDYCLGADRCAIPVETIRTATSWFGIVVQSGEGQVLLARREPGEQKSTGDMFMLEGVAVAVPESAPEKNVTAEAVRSRLNDLAGLSRLDFDFDDTGSGFKGRVSFRDLMAFTFQPQNIVANPDVLFYKADTYEHREKLRTIFPYVLKAVTADVLAAQHELETVSKLLARKERELANLTVLSERWRSEARALAVQSREFGLLNMSIPANASHDELMGMLRSAVTKAPTLASPDGVDDAMQELVALQREETGIDRELHRLRRRLAEMKKLEQNSEDVQNALRVQSDRLGVARWIEDMHAEGRCPLCESEVAHDSTSLMELLSSLAQIEASAKAIATGPASFQRELVRVKQELDLQLEKLGGISIRKAEVERRSEQARDAQYRASEVSRFLGRLERALELQDSLASGGALHEEVDQLRERVDVLSRLVGKPGIESRRRRALEQVASFASRILPTLDSERPDDPIELSITDLTIRVKGTSRDDYLWEIGSGANWLSYHIAVSLALQKFFLKSTPSPVPSFLVYDQPSQVYFPRRLAVSSKGSEDDPSLKDEDIEAVRKAFAALSRAVLDASGKLQIIVLDHAPPEVWDDIDSVRLVEEWREGRKLVPATWLEL